MTPEEAGALAEQYDDRSPQDILLLAFERVDRLALAFSGAEDVVLIAMAAKLGLEPSVFCLDTGRLHGETYRFLEKARKHFGIAIEVVFPEAARVEQLVREKGLFSFYEDGHKECCSIRKVEPLRRKLSGYSGWITGQRRDQNPDTRAHLAVIELDGPALVKFNPLASWSSREVWEYLRGEELPYNELFDRGFASIGCEPCTRAIQPHEPERAGRWWWEQAQHKECGLHVINLEKTKR